MQNFLARLNKEAQKRLEEYKVFQVGDVVHFQFKAYGDGINLWWGWDRPFKIVVLNDSFVVLECNCLDCEGVRGRAALYVYYLDEIEMQSWPVTYISPKTCTMDYGKKNYYMDKKDCMDYYYTDYMDYRKKKEMK